MRLCAVRVLIVLTACLGALIPAADATAADGVRVTGQWVRALGGTIPAAGYFTLHNDTDAAIRLIGASSPECGSLTLHQTMRMHVDSRMTARDPDNPGMVMPGAMDTMQPVESLAIAPRGVVRFVPGSYHLMCEHPSSQVHPGAAIAVRLHFADGYSLESLFAVRGARSPPAD